MKLAGGRAVQCIALHRGTWPREPEGLKSSPNPPVRRTKQLLPDQSKVSWGPRAAWTVPVESRRSTAPGVSEPGSASTLLWPSGGGT